MRKAIALIVILMLVMSSTVAFAAEKAAPAQTQKESVVRKFWGDAADLFRKQIPETPDQHSETHRIWEQTPGRGKTGK
ncbi:MAG: hypothetical protein WBD00_07545 [Candidatus Omnitrophota bacterium]|jgi:hypothetical protein